MPSPVYTVKQAAPDDRYFLSSDGTRVAYASTSPSGSPRDTATLIANSLRDRAREPDLVSGTGAKEQSAEIQTGTACSTLASEANRYIKLGPIKGPEALLLEVKDVLRFHSLCRMLFIGRKQPLREMGVGDYCPPRPSEFPREWPNFPMVEHEGVWFDLTLFVACSTVEESSHYLDYCQREGLFRTKLLLVPTRERSQKALKSLMSSARMKHAAKVSPYYQGIVELLREQT